MLSSELISIIFRIVNFSIVVLAAIYAYRKYFAKSIRQSIKKNQDYFLSLKDKSKDLENRSDLLNVEIEQQVKITNELLEKVIKWKTSYEIERNDQIIKQKYINEKITKKLALQDKLITLNYINKMILPEVLIDIERRLKKEFSTEDNILQFQNELLQFMKQN